MVVDTPGKGCYDHWRRPAPHLEVHAWAYTSDGWMLGPFSLRAPVPDLEFGMPLAQFGGAGLQPVARLEAGDVYSLLVCIGSILVCSDFKDSSRQISIPLLYRICGVGSRQILRMVARFGPLRIPTPGMGCWVLPGILVVGGILASRGWLRRGGLGAGRFGLWLDGCRTGFPPGRRSWLFGRGWRGRRR